MRPTALVAVAAPLLFAGRAVPKFEPDPSWPKPLPNNWMLGQVSGIFVDAHDIWVTNRPRSLEGHDQYVADGRADCCVLAPPVLEFDAAGSLIRGWGGPGPGYAWPDNEHGRFVDHKQNVWIGRNGAKDTNILKFTKTGKFLLQIGHHGNSGGSNDTENLNRPGGQMVYPKTNEVFVADGDGNYRVIVFEADTGAYKHHGGASGNRPDDSVPRTRTYEGPGRNSSIPCMAFASPTTTWCMGDCVNNRIQVFQPDGAFVKEGSIEGKTSGTDATAFHIPFSPDKLQQFFYVPEGPNKKVQILDRETLEVVGWFGGRGGHIYLGESFGQRALKWA